MGRGGVMAKYLFIEVHPRVKGQHMQVSTEVQQGGVPVEVVLVCCEDLPCLGDVPYLEGGMSASAVNRVAKQVAYLYMVVLNVRNSQKLDRLAFEEDLGVWVSACQSLKQA